MYSWQPIFDDPLFASSVTVHIASVTKLLSQEVGAIDFDGLPVGLLDGLELMEGLEDTLGLLLGCFDTLGLVLMVGLADASSVGKLEGVTETEGDSDGCTKGFNFT